MQHPNIIRMHEVCTSKERIYLVMDLATDGDLFAVINQRGALPEWKARGYFKQLLNAVLFCHKRGVYHRDLKPENILLTDGFQTLKLADFGFAAVVDKFSSVHPLLRTNCGSPHYCAPEVWNGEYPRGYAGSKADAFSCGVILYCMLVGVQPFYDSNEDVVLDKVNKGIFSFPDFVNPLARELIQGLLRRNPSERMCLREAIEHLWMAQTAEIGKVDLTSWPHQEEDSGGKESPECSSLMSFVSGSSAMGVISQSCSDRITWT